MIARWQLLALGFSRNEIEHRLRVGRFHKVRRGVYSVGCTELSPEGRWMAAVPVDAELDTMASGSESDSPYPARTSEP